MTSELNAQLTQTLSGSLVFREDSDTVDAGELSGNGEAVTVDLGAGDNRIAFSDRVNGSDGEAISILAGDGDDVILGEIGADWTGSGSDLSLSLGDGASTVSLLDAGISDLTGGDTLLANTGAVLSRFSLDAGAGAHRLYVENAIGQLTASYGAGDHVLLFAGNVRDGSLSLGDGYSAVSFGDFDALSIHKSGGTLLFSADDGTGDLDISAGAGDHLIRSGVTGGAVDIDLGNGDHHIDLGEVDEGFRHVNTIRVGDGNSSISFEDFVHDETGSRGRTEVIAGDGNHHIVAELGHGSYHPGLVMSYKVEVGAGSSDIVFDGSENPNGRQVRVNTLDIDAGAGSHTVLIDAHARNASVDLVAEGDDLVIYDSGFVGRSLVINIHDGDDIVLIDGAGRTSGGERYRIDTGAGQDTVIVYNSAGTDDTGAPLGMQIQNAETVAYAATDLAETLDALGLAMPETDQGDAPNDLKITLDESGAQPVANLTGSIAGRVFAETGDTPGFGGDDFGLAHATVVLHRDGIRVDEMRTNADGTYRFDGLDLGDYMIKVLPPAGGEFTDGMGAASVSVTRGATPEADIGVVFDVPATEMNARDWTSFAADFDTLLRFGGDAESTSEVTYALAGVDADLF